MSKTGSLICDNYVNSEGMVTGGYATAAGLRIMWQDGPLGQGDNRMPPNGAFVEDVLEACLKRLQAFQASPSACEENVSAIDHISAALSHLEDRTKRRIREGVEGTHAK